MSQNKQTDELFNAQLAEAAVKRTAKLNDTTIDLAIRLKDARDFMAWSATHMRQSWMEWSEQADKAVKDMVSLRMTCDRESKSVLAAAKDVRDFFNSPEYLRSHELALEMLRMLERFAELKKNGTLDAFADFILAVQCPTKTTCP
jgi:hypothetical protein